MLPWCAHCRQMPGQQVTHTWKSPVAEGSILPPPRASLYSNCVSPAGRRLLGLRVQGASCDDDDPATVPVVTKQEGTDPIPYLGREGCLTGCPSRCLSRQVCRHGMQQGKSAGQHTCVRTVHPHWAAWHAALPLLHGEHTACAARPPATAALPLLFTAGTQSLTCSTIGPGSSGAHPSRWPPEKCPA